MNPERRQRDQETLGSTRCSRAERAEFYFEPFCQLAPAFNGRGLFPSMAIRFAVEELAAVRALGAWMQVGDERFDGDDIQRLYESDDFPLQRRLSD